MLKLLLIPIALLTVTGLIATVLVHTLTLFMFPCDYNDKIMFLMILLFIISVPVTIIHYFRTRNIHWRDIDDKVLYEGCPNWFIKFIPISMVYAGIVFILTLFFGDMEKPMSFERIMSGVIVTFYACELGILISAIKNGINNTKSDR